MLAKPRPQRLDPANRWRTRDTNPMCSNSTCPMMWCTSRRWWAATPSTRRKTRSTSRIGSSPLGRRRVTEWSNSGKILPMPPRRNQIGEWRLASLKLRSEKCIRCCYWKNLTTSSLASDNRATRMELRRIISLNNRARNFLMEKIFPNETVPRTEKLARLPLKFWTHQICKMTSTWIYSNGHLKTFFQWLWTLLCTCGTETTTKLCDFAISTHAPSRV